MSALNSEEKKIDELKKRQNLSLDEKIKMSQERIIEWYDLWEGNVYVSFSGGKDSTVLLHLVRSIYPHVKGVFINTGLEYPEIGKFVKQTENIEIIRPKIPFHKVIKKYGYPVISKMQAQYIDQYRNTKSEYLKKLRWHGKDYGYGPQYKISEKWKYLINAPFKISDKCCNIMKKEPIKRFNKKTGLIPYIGIMTEDSSQRQLQYIQHGCNAFDLKISRPIAFWKTTDIWEYIHKYKIPYSSIYDVYNGKVKSTGCIFCMFGVHMDKSPNRFEIMKEYHPKLYKYCMEKLELKKVLNFLNINY